METCEDPIVIILIVVFLFLILAAGCGGGYYYTQCKCNDDELFTNLNQMPSKESRYNALYTDKYLYTQPPGDVQAQKFASSGQGTRGGFLPLQGIGAQTYMKNTVSNNHIKPTANTGKIGGQPNFTDKDATTSWIGFQNFPYPDDNTFQSNSYLIEGANERVCNPGQRCESLPSPDWWPIVKKDNKGFSVQGSDLLVTCTKPDKGINNCAEGDKFVRYKNEPEYKKVLNAT